MTDRELNKLNKAELLQMLLEESQELEELREENGRMSKELLQFQTDMDDVLTVDAMIRRLEELGERMEIIESLKETVERLEEAVVQLKKATEDARFAAMASESIQNRERPLHVIEMDPADDKAKPKGRRLTLPISTWSRPAQKADKTEKPKEKLRRGLTGRLKRKKNK